MREPKEPRESKNRVNNRRGELTYNVDEIYTSMPNKHSFMFNLEPLGRKNTNTIFQSVEEPSGLIESIVKRSSAKL